VTRSVTDPALGRRVGAIRHPISDPMACHLGAFLISDVVGSLADILLVPRQGFVLIMAFTLGFRYPGSLRTVVLRALMLTGDFGRGCGRVSIPNQRYDG